MKFRILTLITLAALSIQCNCRQDIIKENVEHAKAQLQYLIDASEEGDTLRIPSTYKHGEINFVPTDDWVSGFFAGTLWYMYELTGDEYYAEKAQKHTEILHDIQYLKWHHDVGFMVYDSYGNGLRLKNIPGYDTVLVNTAKSLATRFRPAAGIIQSWNTDNPKSWQAHKGWKCPVIIDNMMNLELFFKVSEMTGDDTYKNIAMSHADKTIENHYRDDYSTYHVVDYDDETGEIRRKCTAQGIADESRWARGQAWSIYGFTVAYRFTGEERYLQQAEKVANYLLVEEDNMPEDLVPLWDFDVVEFSNALPENEFLYKNLKDKITGYQGRYMVYTLNIKEITPTSTGYLTFAGMSKTKSGAYKDVVAIRTSVEPDFAAGQSATMYLKCIDSYEIQGDSGTEEIPYFDLQWIE